MANVERYNVAVHDELYTEDGSFGDNTPTDETDVASAWLIVRDMLSSIQFSPGHGPFVICDYGTADGINSISLMRNCIDWVQNTYGEDQQVQIIYEDRPTNDFNYLIRYFEGIIPASKGFLQDRKNVFVTCCGRSFYKQCLPDASVHLGFSSLAVMWLSASPRVTSQEVFSVHFPEGSLEQRKFMAQSAADWETFLLHRAKEFAPGGRLVIATLSNTTCRCGETDEWCLHRTLTNTWRDMMQETVISENEFLATIEPNYWHRAEDLSAPFDDSNSRVTRSGLQLVAMKSHVVKWSMSNNQDDSDAARAYAVSIVRYVRTCSTRTFMTGLSNERNEEDRKRILDELYSRLIVEVTKVLADRCIKVVKLYVTVGKRCEI